MRKETNDYGAVEDVMKILSVVYWLLVEFEDEDLVSSVKQEEGYTANRN